MHHGAAATGHVYPSWWTYFGWLKEALEHRFAAAEPDRIGGRAGDAFSLAHFPLVGGIVGFAVAVEETVAHPDDPLGGPVLAALGAGITLFVLSSALSLRILGGLLLVPRLAALVAMVAALVVVAAIAPPPAVPLAIVAAVLLAIVTIEAIAPPDRLRPEHGRPA